MKRSEMVHDIAEIIFEQNRYSDYNRIERLAETIVSFIENCGMEPPSYEGLMRDGKRFVREFHQGYDTMQINNRWEPEDESETEK